MPTHTVACWHAWPPLFAVQLHRLRIQLHVGLRAGCSAFGHLSHALRRASHRTGCSAFGHLSQAAAHSVSQPCPSGMYGPAGGRFVSDVAVSRIGLRRIGTCRPPATIDDAAHLLGRAVCALHLVYAHAHLPVAAPCTMYEARMARASQSWLRGLALCGSRLRTRNCVARWRRGCTCTPGSGTLMVVRTHVMLC